MAWSSSTHAANTEISLAPGQSPSDLFLGTGTSPGIGVPPQTSYVAWTSYQYSHDQVVSTRVYVAIPSSGAGAAVANYDQTSYGYDANGRQDWTETPNGTYTWNVLDAQGLTTSTWVGTADAGATAGQPNGGPNLPGANNMVDMADNLYDADGNLIATTQHVDSNPADDRTTTYQYDWRDRLTNEIDANGGTTSYAYDNADDVLAVTDADGNTTTSYYDPLGQVWKETNAAGASQTYTYDAGGELTSVTDPLGHATELRV